MNDTPNRPQPNLPDPFRQPRRHGNKPSDADQLASAWQQYKHHMMSEDADAKKTALGLITIVLVTVMLCLTVLALTGHLS